MQAIRRRDWRRRFAVTPEHIAATIVKALRADSPEPRYAVPRIVAFLFLLRRLFSDRLFYRLMLGSPRRRAEER